MYDVPRTLRHIAHGTLESDVDSAHALSAFVADGGV